MMQSVIRAYNVNGVLINSIKGTFVESPNIRNVMGIHMVKLNGIETQSFHLVKPSSYTISCTVPAAYNHSSYQALAKGTFDPLTTIK